MIKPKFSIPTILKIATLILMSIPIGWLIYTFFINPYSGIGGGAAHIYAQRSGERERTRELHDIRLSIELYLDKTGGYPEQLQDLVNEGFIIDQTIKDPITNEIYKYTKRDGEKDYIIQIPFGKLPANINFSRDFLKSMDFFLKQRLENDEDGVISGINCDDPLYCASSNKF